MVGMALAFLVKDHSLCRIPNLINWILTTLSYFVYFVLIYVFNYSNNKKDYDDWSNIEQSLVFALGPFVWSLATAYLIYTFMSKQGGWAGWILSRPMWVPLARLTYQVYLVHPCLVALMTYSMSSYPSFTISSYVWASAATTTLAFFVAFLGFVLVEQPLMNLEKYATQIIAKRK